MKKHIMATIIALTFAQSATAKERSDDEKNNEMIGFGTGAVVGTAIAGPIGGLAGSIIGLFFADNVNDENNMQELSASLESKNGALLALQSQVEVMQQQHQMQLVSLDQQIEKVLHDTQASIQFKTGSYVLEPHYAAQLDLVGQALVQNPQAVITLVGYADRRGDDTFNQALSEQRVLSVKAYLLEKGADTKQIVTQSLGESSPVMAEQSVEGDFFDRRVTLTLHKGKQQMTAAK